MPETARYDNMLFIECLLSNDTTSSQIVIISFSGAIRTEDEPASSIKPRDVSGAEVRVVRDDHESYYFEEFLPGHYTTSNLVPEVGRAYQLIVVYDENVYKSEYETMLESPPIDSISVKHKVERVGDIGDFFDGYKFYVSNHRDQPGPSYYRWECESTYHFRVPFSATHIYDGSTQIEANNDALRSCWSTQSINDIFIGSSEGLSKDIIVESPIHFESQVGYELTRRYSLLVKQLALTKSAWTFWSDMLKQVNQNGGMFDTQPFRIKGNIRCTTDPEIFVSGIFELAGYSEKRIFVNRPIEFWVYPEHCQYDTVPQMDFPWEMIPPGSFLTYDDKAGVYLFSSPECFDCTQKGGVIEKPSFWENGN